MRVQCVRVQCVQCAPVRVCVCVCSVRVRVCAVCVRAVCAVLNYILNVQCVQCVNLDCTMREHYENTDLHAHSPTHSHSLTHIHTVVYLRTPTAGHNTYIHCL